jgi:peptide deformylase
MRFGATILSCFVALCVACGDPASTPSGSADAGGSAGVAGSAGEAGQTQDASPGGGAGQAGGAGAAGAEPGPEAGPEASAEDASDADSAVDYTCVDAGTPTQPPPLTAEESELILAEDDTMPMEIVTNVDPDDDAFLHQIALPIDPNDATVEHLIARMRATLAASAGGVGLAAPQVGISRRLFLAARMDQTGSPVQPFLNPLITAYSPETSAGAEGCLSVPDSNVTVTRSKWVTVSYETADGARLCDELIGSTTSYNAAFTARIVQHEFDHLEGILIVDP